MEGENGYLTLIKKILSEGERKSDRTGVGTLSLVGTQLRFDLSKSFPLFTCKRTNWKAIKEELLWFISGNTNANTLAAKGVHIWDQNATRSFLDKRGLIDNEEGDLGPIYGAQWRSFGGRDVDQLANCIKQIKENPDSRRIIMTAWNPLDLHKMALEPCHVMCQFIVTKEHKGLSCVITQRSADMGLGVPFNVASYALLTYMIADMCNLTPDTLVLNMGDCHIYLNHVDALTEMVATRKPMEQQPNVHFTAHHDNIDNYTSDDIHLMNYVCHPAIKLEMAV